jgi:hypothetical protein
MTVQNVTLDVDRLIDAAKGRVTEAIHEALQDLNETIITRTPVDTGFLRSSWFSALDRPTSDHEGSANVPFGIVVSRLNLVASAMPKSGTYYLLNNCAYAAFQEYGTSKMPGRAFVRSTVAQFPAIVRAAAIRVAAGDYGGARLGGGGVVGGAGYVAP